MRLKRVLLLNLSEKTQEVMREPLTVLGFESVSFIAKTTKNLEEFLKQNSPLDLILLSGDRDLERLRQWVLLVKQVFPKSFLILLVPSRLIETLQGVTELSIDFILVEPLSDRNIYLVFQRILEFQEVKNENRELWSQVLELTQSKLDPPKIKKIEPKRTAPKTQPSSNEFPTLSALKERYIHWVLKTRGTLLKKRGK